MIDIHNHMIFDVDDGSRSIEESVEIIKKMSEYGYTDIILTPHYIVDSNYNSSKTVNLEKMEQLKKELLKESINVNLYLGNEIYIDEKIYDLIKKDEISTMNDTNYLLIELPMSGEYSGYLEYFHYLITKGYKIILAHPERYLSFQEDFDKIYELVNLGVYLQSNIDSMIGKYGPDSKRVLIRLLKEKIITFLATDIHHAKRDYSSWNYAKKEILTYISEKEFNELTIENPIKLLR